MDNVQLRKSFIGYNILKIILKLINTVYGHNAFFF
jgi:hypothetical protein